LQSFFLTLNPSPEERDFQPQKRIFTAIGAKMEGKIFH